MEVSPQARWFLAYPPASVSFCSCCELTLPRCHDAAPLEQKHSSTTGAAMDAIRSALSIVPSGTAATIIVGHALLTKVMICVETNQ